MSKPSDAALAKAFWEWIQNNGWYLGDKFAALMEVEKRAREIDATNYQSPTNIERIGSNDMLDADSAWNRKRVELTDKLVAAANELITHTGACRIAIPSGDIEVTIEHKDYAEKNDG